MRVLMLGWEFPPFISGGLGTACFGLTRAMSELGTDVLFVLPKSVQSKNASHVTLVTPTDVTERMAAESHTATTIPAVQTHRAAQPGLENVLFHSIDVDLFPYGRPGDIAPAGGSAHADAATLDQWEEAAVAGGRISRETLSFLRTLRFNSAPASSGDHYGGDLFTECDRYAAFAAWLAARERFDVIHAHDWMTFRAGMVAAAVSGKPLVVHVHSTEFDRSGEHVNQRIYDIERQGMHAASRIIAVSHLTKNIVTARYGVAADKIGVVYNAIDLNGTTAPRTMPTAIARDEKIVLFLGRITMQKGPEYFLGAARKVLSVMDNVRFIMAGWGDMVRKSIELAAVLGIGHKVLFTGFLRGNDVDRVFKMADLYVMPSVSEPFGIAPLEALSHDVPVIISKQSGVAEVLTHALKVDFWDIDEMANKIVAVLRHPPLRSTLQQHGTIEVRRLTWRDAARRCIAVYRAAHGPGLTR